MPSAREIHDDDQSLLSSDEGKASFSWKALLCGAFAMLVGAGGGMLLANAFFGGETKVLPSGVPSVTEDDKPTIVLATDVDWPPYAFKDDREAGENGGLQGFGKDFGEAAGKACDLNIVFVQSNWKNCWDSEGYKPAAGTEGEEGYKPGEPGLGTGLLSRWYSGCSTYTHLQGVRNRFGEFSDAILNQNKPAGLLVLLTDGVPTVDGLSNLAGKTVVDVGGWAPTADTIAFVKNQCTQQQYAPVCPATGAGGSDCITLKVGEGNDESMKMLRNRQADAMFVYADQAYNYECDANGKAKHSGAEPTWDCTLWKGFGTEYAYVQTGQFGHALNGTTLALSPKGSGIADILNPCIQKFLKTKEYYDLCKKHDLVDSCYRNEYFPGEAAPTHEYMKATNAHTTGCTDGYCNCPAAATQ